MNALESLLRKMELLRLYDLSEGSRVRAEMEAYAAGLQPLTEQLLELQAEMMVSTAGGEGLEQYERLLPAWNADLTLPQRRQRVLSALGMKPSDSREEREERISGLFQVPCTFEEAAGEWQLHLPPLLDDEDFMTVILQMQKLRPMGVRVMVDEED